MHPAIAYCQGTPLRTEIESRGAVTVEEATRLCEEKLSRQFGSGFVDAKIQAHIVTVEA
jgi:hypothetical protein